MSLDKGRPGTPLGRPTMIGLPHHGLVIGSKLTLPNGVEIDYPQPDKGGTYVVRRPGWVAPPRSEAGALYDTANGFEWRDYALINGSIRSDIPTKMHLGGRELNGWIWFAPTGQAWRVEVIDFGGFNNAARVHSFRFSRFGVFGGEPESITRSTAPFDIGQAIAQNVEHRDTEFGTMKTLDANTMSIRHKLVDITEDGSRTMWCAYALHYTFGNPGIFIERPVAFYEIVISQNVLTTESGTVSGFLLKGRMDCIGDLSLPPELPNLCNVTTLSVELPTQFSNCIVGQSWEMETSLASGGAVQYAKDISIQSSPIFGALGRTEPTIGVGSLAPESYTREYAATVAGWYASGSPQFATVHIKWTRTRSGWHELTPIRNSVTETCTNGVYSISAPALFSYSSTNSEVFTAKVALKVGANELVQETLSTERSTSMSGTGELVSYGLNVGMQATGTSSATLKRNGSVISTTSNEWDVTSDFYRGGSSFAHLFGPDWVGNLPSNPIDGTPSMMQAFSLFPITFGRAGEGPREITIAHWDATTLGLVAQRLASDGGAEHQFARPIARGLLIGEIVTYAPPSGFDVPVTPYGAYQPVTEEWTWSISEGVPIPAAWV